MIELQNWHVGMNVADRKIGFEGDHLYHKLMIATDLDTGWAVKLDMALGQTKNVVDLEQSGNMLWVELTRDILAADGLYCCQLRGLKGDMVVHSNQFVLKVSGSINAVDAFPDLEPSELAQMEARVTQAKAAAVAAADRAEAAAEILPSVKVARTESGALLTAVDTSGTTTAEVMDGVQGPAGIGVPAGGKSGQLLTRTEDGTAWQDAPESAVQPDWAQNDPTAKDYIKNRTHYETEESICDVDLTWPGGHISGNVPYTTAPVAGETYKVVIDGSAYTAAATQYSDTVIEIKPSISIRWDTAAQTVYGYNQGGYYGTRHVAVYRSVPHPLDPKYLPEYVITITQTANSESNITVTCDRTFAEILSASNSGMLLKVVVKLDAPSLSISGKIVTRHIEYVDDGESEQFAVYSPYLNLGYLITAEGISIGK